MRRVLINTDMSLWLHMVLDYKQCVSFEFRYRTGFPGGRLGICEVKITVDNLVLILSDSWTL